MHKPSRIVVSRLRLATLCVLLATESLLAQTSVRTVKVLGSKDAVEIEVEASDRIVPQTQVLTGPDRLVIDFPNAVPSNRLRSQSVDRGQVKNLRVGLFQSKPPVTRVVLDLKSAQSYQVFPSGRTVIIKVMGGAIAPDKSAGVDNFPPEPAARPGLVIANYTTGAERIMVESPPKPPLEVTYRDGLLGIKANKVTLSEVLFAVQQKTGAEISIAAGAEQEQVVADIAPAPAPEVLARLLNGSKFNFLILNAVSNPRLLDRVILSTRTDGGGAAMPLPSSAAQGDEPVDEPESQPPPPNRGSPAAVEVPPSQPEMKAPADDGPPEQ